jgi:CRISPR-associated protein (TIGR02584 family)
MKNKAKSRQTSRPSVPSEKTDGPPNNRSGNSEIVLLAVTGMSPAILTETIWALANEQPPIIPDKIRVITTGTGKACIERELFTPSPDYGGASPWDALRALVLQGKQESDHRLFRDEIRTIMKPDAKSGTYKPLDDIRSAQDNEAAADFLLDEVRRITENPDTTLIASMAGGRKTLGALLYACVSLIGRTQDRLTHVLVTEPFDNPELSPRFYFPKQPHTAHQIRDPKTDKVRKFKSTEARVELVDVPFVRLRNLFPDQIGKFPGRFNALVNMYSGRITEIIAPEVRLLKDRSAMVVNGVTIDIAPREYALYAYMLDRAKRNAPTNILQKDCLDELKVFLPKWAEPFDLMSFQRDAAQKWNSPIEDDLRKQFSSIRTKCKNAGLTAHISNLLPLKGRFGINVRTSED